MIYRFAILTIVTLFSLAAFSQDSLSLKQVERYSKKVLSTATVLNQKLDKKSARALRDFEKLEGKLKKKLSKIDSVATSNLMGNTEERYAQLKQKLINSTTNQQYIPHLDTLISSLKYLGNKLPTGEGSNEISRALSATKALEGKFQSAEEIRAFLRERKEFLREQLSKFGLVKELKKLNKQVYYYGEQIKEYKETLKDPKKIEKKMLETLSKTKLFQDFLARNSMLASLFRMPGTENDPSYLASLAALQTRSQVNNLIQQQISSGGPNAQAIFSQNLQQAQSQINQLKNKVLSAGKSSSDEELPDFKPNDQKSKSFLKRLEYSTNIQTQKAQNFLPSITDLGLSIGFRMNAKSVVGIGASYKIGFGNGWNNIRFTQQGAGLRSYIDWKIKGSFWLSGGYEMNYRNLITSISQLENQNAWAQSGLVGVSKIVSVKTKFFKKTKLMLLWDFLSYRQIPKTQAVVFRVGYSLK
jgi:hypothetical protein